MPSQFLAHRPARFWTKVTIETDSDLTDSVAVLLADLTDTGVELHPVPTKGREAVIGYLPVIEGVESSLVDLEKFLNDLRSNFPEADIQLATATLKEEDWGEKWKENFKPIQLTSRLVIRPSWEDYQPTGDEIVIEMDPGMAFGTGHHASTKLALELTEIVFNTSPPNRVLDVGCGTAILAMAAAGYGALHILALDNDPDAIAAASANVTINRMEDRVTVKDIELGQISEKYALILANITSDVLLAMAPRLIDLLAPKGFLILSGILREEQQQAIAHYFSSHGLTIIKNPVQDEWTAFLFQRA